ncbi:MAG: type II secretion system F family protein [Smithellaceae bacterium]|nr:type II secretion system F family protein [Smithellaceae bacterium]
MPIFSYRATTMEGALSEGVMEAADRGAVVVRLKDAGTIPLDIEEAKDRAPWYEMGKRVREADVGVFTSELSALLKAGLPLDRSLQVLAEVLDSAPMRETARSLLKSIREGASFSGALEKRRQVFSALYVNMVRAGEAGGVLDAVLERLGEYLESYEEMKSNIISALIYPAILLFSGVGSIIILFIFVLPRFSDIFSDLGANLPLATRVVLGLSAAAKSYGWIVIVLLAALVYLFFSYKEKEPWRSRLDATKLKLMGDVIRKLETARFCRTLGTLLMSGVPMLQALGNAGAVIDNRVMAKAIEGVAKGVKEGRGIAAPLEQAGVLPALALSMIKVGEETGQLDQMLLRVSAIYEKSLKEAVKRLMNLLEPAMILLMGLIIGFIVVSMLLAVFSISDIPF